MKALKITVDYPDRTVTLNGHEADIVMKHIGTQQKFRSMAWKVKVKSVKHISPKKGTIWQEDSKMDLKQFVKYCRQSPQCHIQIIGEWAEELNDNFSFDGFTTYGEWNNLFLDQNLRAARKLTASWKQDAGRSQMSRAAALCSEESKNNNFKVGNLSTLIKYMLKV